jgi:hypothetical protein
MGAAQAVWVLSAGWITPAAVRTRAADSR